MTRIINFSACIAIIVISFSPSGRAMAQSISPSTIPDFVVMPDDGYGPLTELLAAATKEITVVTPSLTDPVIFNALRSARKRGVTVRVMLDKNPAGLSSGNARTESTLTGAKILTLWSNPKFRNMRESVIITDGRIAAVLTAPLTQEALAKGRSFAAILLDPRYAQELTNAFDADVRKKLFKNGFAQTAFSPGNARGMAKDLIRAAQHSLWIYSESISDEDVADAIVKMARSGIMVKVLTSDTSAAGGPGIVRLTQGGCTVRVLPSLQIHGTVILTDAKTEGAAAFLGSQALTAPSFDDNRELAVMIGNARRTGRLRAIFEKDWAAASR